MFCRNCGKELEESWVKCPYCGTEVLNTAIKEDKEEEERGEAGDISAASIEQDKREDYVQEKPVFSNVENQTSSAGAGDGIEFPRNGKIAHRSFWKYLILSMVTCGIYGIVVLYGYVKDINKVCEGDGKESKNYIVVLLLTIVTCGIYGLYWWYTQGERLYNAAPKYGVRIKEKGSTILVWEILGCTLMPSIGMLVATYIMFDNMNRIALAYNGEASEEELSKMEEPHRHLIRNVIIIYAVLFVVVIGIVITALSSLFSDDMEEDYYGTNIDVEELGEEEDDDYSYTDLEEFIGQPESVLKDTAFKYDKDNQVYEIFDGDVTIKCEDGTITSIIITGDEEYLPNICGVEIGMDNEDVDFWLEGEYEYLSEYEGRSVYYNSDFGAMISVRYQDGYADEIIGYNLTAEEIQDLEVIFPVQVVNNTGVDLYGLFASEPDVDNWEEDLLGDNILYAGGTQVVNFYLQLDTTKWDFAIMDAYGNMQEYYNIDFRDCSGEGAVLTFEADGTYYLE